jgi:hypothetical protein
VHGLESILDANIEGLRFFFFFFSSVVLALLSLFSVSLIYLLVSHNKFVVSLGGPHTKFA